MKQYFQFLFILFFIIGCNNIKEKENPNESSNDGSSISPPKVEPIIDSIILDSINYEYLSLRVFEIGSKYDFTDTCAFYFECDCCFGELLFNSDSTFYLVSYCVTDETFSFGNYNLKDQILTLNYSGICVSQLYNWENETDTSATDYFITDTVITARKKQYQLEVCNNKLKLIETKSNEVAIETNDNRRALIKHFNNVGFIKRHEQLKDSLENNIDYNYAKSYVLVLDTNANYYFLRNKMFHFRDQLSLEIDTMERTYYSDKKLIALPEDHQDELFAGDYYPRRFPKEALSLEYLDLYQRSAGNKTIALVAGIYSNQKSANSTLQRVLSIDSSAFIIETDMYVGCIH